MNTKNDFFCGSKGVKKNGQRGGRQRYKCASCGRQFNGGKRLNPDELWAAYSAGKQTAAELAAQYGCSSKTIYRRLQKVQVRERYPQPAKANIIMDTTYFGRDFGVMVLMDSISGQALFVGEVKHETNALYSAALNTLQEKGIEIQSIVCDGRKKLLQLFPNIPTQLCQFHQVKTVSRYLTRNPKTAAGKALWRLALKREAERQGRLSKRPYRRGLRRMRAFSTSGRSTKKRANRTTRTRS